MFQRLSGSASAKKMRSPNSDSMGFYSDSMGFYGDLMGYEWDIPSGND